MKKLPQWFWAWIVVIASTIMAILAPPVRGQEAESAIRPAGSIRTVSGSSAVAQQTGGVASDWSHRHLIYSHPGTADDARGNGTYDRWLRITSDPRYAMQLMRRSGAGPGLSLMNPPAPNEEFSPQPAAGRDKSTSAEKETPPAAAHLPAAKLPRGLIPARIQPSASEAELAPFPSRPGFHAPVFRPRFRRTPNLIQKDWSENIGTGGTVGEGNFPATFTHTGADCANDFAVYNTSLPGSASQASIVAFNGLYSVCGSPGVYWAFDTLGTIQTSVALSVDGSQVAFVQTDNSTGHADLVLLKWKASSGTLAAPTVLTNTIASSYPGCITPCMTVIPFSGNPTDTYSSPYIDYPTGTAYVGDDAGAIHKFTNIFTSGTPAEAGSPWPVTLNTSADAALGSPVYDSGSGNIFVGDYLANISSNCQPGIKTARGNCGFLYSIGASSGAVVQSAQLDYNLGIYDAPIVDPSAEKVYVFVGADNSTNCSNGPCAAVFQFSTGFSSGNSGIEATAGAGYNTLFAGAFDNQYFTSAGSSPTGHLYVVGGTGPQNNTLYAIAINGGGMTAGAATAGPQLATNYTAGSFYAPGLQVSEFCNNGGNACSATQGTDYLFLSVLAFGAQFSSNPCPSPGINSGCVMGFTAPSGSAVVGISATPNGTLQEAGGASGIVVDNGASGASNIYFSTLANQTCTTSGGTGGCAVSATQAALH